MRYTVKAGTPAETPGKPYWFVVDGVSGERVAGGFWRSADAQAECERRNDAQAETDAWQAADADAWERWQRERGTVTATVEPLEGEDIEGTEDEDALVALLEGTAPRKLSRYVVASGNRGWWVEVRSNGQRVSEVHATAMGAERERLRMEANAAAK